MRKETALLLFLVVLKFTLPLLVSHPVYELHRDEYLYYQQGQHLAFGYLENPPLIGVLAWLSSLAGGGYFWIKFWPLLFGAATLWVSVKIVKELGGGFYAQCLAALGIIFTAYLRIHFLFQPNFLEIFFWTLSAYFVFRYINTKNQRFIFYLSFSLVLGWYSKYSVLFFVAGLFGGLILTKHRVLFTKRYFWQALFIGILLILPNIFWQYHHNWPLVHHMKELQETQLQHLNRADFLKEQLLFLLPVAFLWMGGFFWLLKQQDYRPLAYSFLLIVFLIMMGSGKGYYTLGAYPMLLAAGGVWAQNLATKNRFLKPSFLAVLLLLALPFVPLLLPVQPPSQMANFNKKFGIENLGVLRWEDGKNHPLQQDFADMIGWKELAEKTEKIYQQQPDSIKKITMIYCANYGLAASMRYFAKDPNFKDKIFSENGSFLLWSPDSLSFKYLLLIDDEMPDEEDDVLQRFASMKIVDSCTNLYSRQYGNKIFYFKNASDSASIIASRDIRKEKEKFTR